MTVRDVDGINVDELLVQLLHWKHHPDGGTPRMWAEAVEAMREAANIIYCLRGVSNTPTEAMIEAGMGIRPCPDIDHETYLCNVFRAMDMARRKIAQAADV